MSGPGMERGEIDRRLNQAVEIARDAAALALHHFRHRDELTIEAKRNPQDQVSEADREVETLIREALTAAFPDDAQLGEEHGLSEGLSGLTWVIDPIDGTAPFLAGLPGWCVSIGALDARGPVIGVIVAPVLGEAFAAARDVGATLNGKAIRITDTLDLTSGLLGFGANDRVSSAAVGQTLSELMAAGGSWTRYGSGALMLAWVAAGRLVGYVEPRMSAWDCMAGYCLIREAGGCILDFPAGEGLLRPAPVLGASQRVYDTLLDLTRLDDAEYWTGSG